MNCHGRFYYHFNSRPRKEVDRSNCNIARGTSISTHDLARRSTISPIYDRSYVGISTHDLARRSTLIADTQAQLDLLISTHDLARRSTKVRSQEPILLQYFNSRPRKEVDPIRTSICQGKSISTHDLARRSTFSTNWAYSFAIFQLTTSQGGRRRSSVLQALQLQFQLTTSQGGRPLLVFFTPVFPVFQLTTSQGGRPAVASSNNVTNLFQLTTSQGGRRRHRRLRFMKNHFNSRPRKEVDFVFLLPIRVLVLFQLTTSQGGRLLLPFIHGSPLVFQLTTSQGGRQNTTALTGFSNVFQLTTSQGGRLKYVATRVGTRTYFNSRPRKEVDYWSLGHFPEAFLFQLTTSQGGRQRGGCPFK